MTIKSLPKRASLPLIVILGLVSTAFALAGGWLTSTTITPARFVQRLEEASGVHSGFRRNHAKGVCVSGYFESDGGGAQLSKAAIFQMGRSDVVGRFSPGGGDPYSSDSPNAPLGLGLRFKPLNGQEWRTAMINLPVFPVRTPEAFFEHLAATRPDPKTRQPDPLKLQAFAERFPEFAAARNIIRSQPPSSGFHDSTFHGLNAFLFTNAAGESVPVRWSFEPLNAQHTQEASESGRNFLFDALLKRLHGGPLRWRLILVVGQSGDPTNDASRPWPAERQRVDAGTLTIDRAESDDTSETAQFSFDPLILPEGIQPSDDPLLSARSAVYSRAFTKRAGEVSPPAEIAPCSIPK
jgi:catalase